MGETNGNHRSIFSMRSTAAPPPSRVPRGRTQMAKSIARFLVAVMAVAAMALASVAGTGLAQAQTNTPTDRDALVTLYNATSGDNWANNDNWLSDGPMGEWHGVTTDSDGRVTHLDLRHNQLTGGIPAELGGLSNLTRLYLSNNQLTGEIPAELGDLTSLTTLLLFNNQLTGEIPAELGSLAGLEWLYLDNNQLTGEIPAELGSLAGLEGLFLGENGLTGCIPGGLRDVPLNDLDELGLDYCMPAASAGDAATDRAALVALYNATDGANWRINGNWLSNAPMGEWDGVTTNSDGWVTHLDLQGNQLTGEIPAELGSLTNLERLWLAGNQLTGEIPAELGSLTNLEGLSLNDNQLTGEIPAELGSLTNLEELFLNNNQLTGEIPAELGGLSNLTRLWLQGNQLTGEIPAELGDLTRLTVLYLHNNQLTGEIPAELGSLTHLDLQYNQLTGEIPSELGDLTRLTELSLHHNQLTGEIPSELGSLTNLERLWLAGNQLTGEIPAELGDLTKLKYLDLSNNQLTGEIPAELGSLANLQWLYLYGNQLSGEIPGELGSLTNLQGLHLHGNQLSGEIPSELGSLANLQWLHLYGNQLSGEIPAELGSLTDLEELFLSGNQLTGCIPVGIAGVANNDFNQLGLPFCAGASGAPTIGTLTPGADFLTITWAAPTGSPESAIIAYDLRYIESAARDKSDVNWTVVDNAWTAGSGALSYQIAGLTDGTQYDVQVRAVSAAGDGPWSATAQGTPATWGAIRSFSPPSVAPAGEVVVMITASGYGWFGAVTETLPPGFSYVSSSLSDDAVTVEGRELSFILRGETSFTYTVTAPGAAGHYSFSGVLSNSEREVVPVGGALITNVDELGMVSGDDTASYAENGMEAVAAYTADGPVTVEWSLSGTDADDFDINGGMLTFKASPDFETPTDADTDNIYEVTVQANAGGEMGEVAVTITVTNEDETGRVTLWASATDALTMAPQVGDTITGAVMDPDGGVTGESWQWAKTMDDMDSRDMDSWMPITGATDAAYMVTADDTDHYLRVMATYMDAAGTDMAMEYSMPTMMVDAMAGDTLLERYDANDNDEIDLYEVFKAIDDYFDYDDRLTLEEVYEIVDLYFES